MAKSSIHIRFGVGLEYINVAPYWRLAAVVFHAGQPDVGYVIPVGKPQENIFNEHLDGVHAITWSNNNIPRIAPRDSLISYSSDYH